MNSTYERHFFQRLRLVAVLLIAAATTASPAVAQSLDLGRNEPSMEAAKPWLGIAIGEGKAGVLVNEVLPNTPAAGAGLQHGDEITAINTTTVKAPAELIKTVQDSGVGNQVDVHYLRRGQALSVKVKLVARPDELAMLRERLVGKPMPPFKLQLVSGSGSGDSAALKGKVTVVEFWATWCPACRSTHERLSAFAKEHATGGKNPEVAVIAISDEDPATIKAYVNAKKPAFTVLSDAQGTTQQPWNVAAIPEMAVVDRTGTIVYATIGAGEYLEEVLAKAEEVAKTVPSKG